MKYGTLAGNEGEFLSKIRNIQDKTKVKLEFMHVNTKEKISDRMHNCGINLLAQWYLTQKRCSCEKDNREEFLHIKVIVTVCSNSMRSETTIVEIVKTNESTKHSSQYAKKCIKKLEVDRFRR